MEDSTVWNAAQALGQSFKDQALQDALENDYPLELEDRPPSFPSTADFSTPARSPSLPYGSEQPDRPLLACRSKLFSESCVYQRRQRTVLVRRNHDDSLRLSKHAARVANEFRKTYTAHVYDPSRTTAYNLILSRQEILIEFAKAIRYEELLDLYCICRDFHDAVDMHRTMILVGNAQIWAPESAKIFPYLCYREMCEYDPMLKARLPNPKTAKPDQRSRFRLSLIELETAMKRVRELLAQKNIKEIKSHDPFLERHVRDVPTFRWLHFVYEREGCVDSIVRHLAEAGHRMPRLTTASIKKLWFLLELPDSARRIGLAHNREWLTSPDLYLATLFFIKLDMRFTRPTSNCPGVYQRKMLMNQRTLAILERVLAREELPGPYDALNMLVEWRENPYVPDGIDLSHLPPGPQQAVRSFYATAESVFGVPKNLMGSLSQEDWAEAEEELGDDGLPQRKPLIQIEALIAKEAFRRGLKLEDHFLDMLLYGYVDPRNGRDVWSPSMVATQRALEAAEYRKAKSLGLPRNSLRSHAVRMSLEAAGIDPDGGNEEKEELSKAASFEGYGRHVNNYEEVLEGEVDPSREFASFDVEARIGMRNAEIEGRSGVSG